MSAGLLDVPSIASIAQEMEALNLDPKILDLIGQYALIMGLQSQLGQVGLQNRELDVRDAEIDFKLEHELPFRQESMENDRILAQLGIEGRNIDLQSQRELAQIRAQEGEQRLQQVREIGEYDAFQNEIARQTALINKSIRQEELAAMQTARRRGRGTFTPRGIGG